MHPQEDSESIGFRYVPLAKWVWGTALFLAFSIFTIGLIFSARYRSIFSDSWENIFLMAIFIFFSIVSVFDGVTSSFMFAPLVTVDICLKSNYIEYRKKRIYGTKVERLYFSQVTKFKSYKSKLNFSQQYFLALVLVNRKTLKLNLPIGKDKQDTVKLIKRLNKIFKTADRT